MHPAAFKREPSDHSLFSNPVMKRPAASALLLSVALGLAATSASAQESTNPIEKPASATLAPATTQPVRKRERAISSEVAASLAAAMPKYNPPNKRFKIEHWQQVCFVVEDSAEELGVPSLASWAREAKENGKPRKPEQDKLDSTLCALIGLMWRAAPRDRVAMLGDLSTGYMITPISDATRDRLKTAAHKKAVTMS